MSKWSNPVNRRDNFFHKPLRIGLSGDVEFAKLFIPEAKSMLFQLRNRQQAGDPVQVDNKVFPVFAEIPRGEGPLPTSGPVEFPVPIIAVHVGDTETYKFCDDDPVGGYVAAFFIGDYFEYVLNNDEGKVEYSTDERTLSELVNVGENWLIDSEYEVTTDSWETTMVYPETSGTPWSPPSGYCPDGNYDCSGTTCVGATCCDQSDACSGSNCEPVDFGQMPATYLYGDPFPLCFGHGSMKFNGIGMIPIYYQIWGCLAYDNTLHEVIAINAGLGDPDSAIYDFEVDAEFTEARRYYTTGPVEIDLGNLTKTGYGTVTGNVKVGTFPGCTAYYHNVGNYSGVAPVVDMSSYWDNAGTDCYILGIVGKRYYPNTKDTTTAYDTYGLSIQDGGTYKWGYYLSVITPEGEWFLHEETPVLDTEYSVWTRHNFNCTDIFDYNGTPFYTYNCEVFHIADPTKDFTQYGMIYQGKHYSVRFPGIRETKATYAQYHTFESALYTNAEEEQNTVSFPVELSGLYGAGYSYQSETYKPAIFAGKYNVK